MSYLVSLNRNAWSGSMVLSEQDIPGASGLSKEVVRLGTKRFVDSGKNGPLGFVKVVYNKAWNPLQEYGIKVGSTAYIITDNYLDKITDILDKACEEYNQKADEFCANYDTHLDNFLAEHPNEEKLLRGMAPNVNQVRAKFGLSYSLISIDQFVNNGQHNDNKAVFEQGLRDILADIAKRASKKMWSSTGVSAKCKATFNKIIDMLEARLEIYPELQSVIDFVKHWKDNANNAESVKMMCNVLQLPNLPEFIKQYDASSYIPDADLEHWTKNLQGSSTLLDDNDLDEEELDQVVQELEAQEAEPVQDAVSIVEAEPVQEPEPVQEQEEEQGVGFSGEDINDILKSIW